MTESGQAIIITVGDEITSGDIENTNGSWIARKLAGCGLTVALLSAVPDDVETIAGAVRDARERCALVVVTGGLGGTPDDVTREGIARAFGVGVELHEDAAAVLRARFGEARREYVERFATLPTGATPVTNPLGGAPGFTLGNVLVLAGVPAEMQATFEAAEPALRARHGCPPIVAVRRTYDTTEADIVPVLEEVTREHPSVAVGSYPHYENGTKRVEIVLKSSDESALATAVSSLESGVGQVLTAT